MSSYRQILLVVALAITTLLSTAVSHAAAKAVPKGDGLFGKITAVDTTAKTITLGGKVIVVDETTVITESGKPAKFESLKTGTDATVATFKLGEKLTAVSIKTGVVPAAAPATKKKK